MSYRDKPNIWEQDVKPVDRKALLWSLGGMMCFNLGLLGTNAAKSLGWHVSLEVIQWLAIGLGFICLAAGVVAGRSARAQAQRDIDAMMPPNYRG